tara:strand:+ start:54 stop:308 length:255 start_codon:yes stop_codon:yes gene_type:complete
MTNIDYINAYNGGIKMYSGVGNVVGWGKTAKHIAYVIATHGLADAVFGGSSMDFADEEGFDHYDDAKILWDEALAMAEIMKGGE